MGAKGGSRALREIVAERGAANVNNLLRNIVTGQTAPAPGAFVPRNALARLLATQNTKRAAGNYAASFVDEDKNR